jgi:transposase
MARPQERFHSNTAERMRELLRQSKSVPETKRIQCILFRELKEMDSESIAALVGFSPSWVKSVWGRFRKYGEKGILGENRGGRYHALLDTEEEKHFLKPFIKKANSAGILIVSEVHRAYEEKYGKKVYSSVIYDLLHRHNWRKIAPRPSHPKGDPEAREEYKALVFPPNNNTGKG